MDILLPFAVAVLGAVAMALGFPKTNAAALVPVGAAALFWAWFGLSPKRAFLAGWLAGTIYFALVLSWIGETAGALVAPFGFVLVLAPALVEGLTFGVAGVLAVLAVRRARPDAAALAAAAAFAFVEWVRSSGAFGMPFGDLSYAMIDTPFAPLAAFAGSFGITFALAVPAAYAARAVRARFAPSSLRALVVAIAVAACALAIAWVAWPARILPPATIRVAAAQGNIRQTLKWSPAALPLAIERYEALSIRAATSHPAFILWPETVITTDLNLQPSLVARFAALAARLHTELIVGSKEQNGASEYNALFFFTSDGRLDAVYRKRRLVPFVEQLPWPNVLGDVPGASLVSRFASGTVDGVVDTGGVRLGPLICWESAFPDLSVSDVRDGADALVIATDDAWFGTTAGPYQHADIARMRAIETGRYVVRAGATGISGIVAPNGRWTSYLPLGEAGVVDGDIGPPVATPFDTIGDAPIALALLTIYVVALTVGRRRWR